jgi:hypothetical protein
MKSSTLTSRAARRIVSVVDLFVAEANVFADGAGEEERILQDDGEVAAQFSEIVFAQIDTVQENAAGGDLVEAHHEAGERGFARAGVTDDGNCLAGLDGEGDVLQDPFDAGDGGQGGGVRSSLGG